MAPVQRLPRQAHQPGGGAQLPGDLEGALCDHTDSRQLLIPPLCRQIPAVLFYERVDARDMLDFSPLPLSGDPSILSEDITVSR